MVALHDAHGFRYGMVGAEVDRIGYDAVFGALDPVYFSGLSFNGHVSVDNPDATFPGYGYGHAGFSDRIHGGANDGNVKSDSSGEPGRNVYFPREDLRLSGNQQYIVEAQTFAAEFFIRLQSTYPLRCPSPDGSVCANYTKAGTAGNPK
jgi:hypothetical protein